MGWRTALARAALLLALPLACGAAQPQAFVVPDCGESPVGAPYLQAIVERDTTTIVDVAAGSLEGRMRLSTGKASVAFNPHNELWVRLDLRNPRGETQAVQLMVRQTSLNELTFFNPQGTVWHTLLAGDSVPQSGWSRPGRFARFDLALAPLEERTVYLRVRNNVPAPVPLQVGAAAAAELWIARSDFGLAFALGALAILALASFIQAALYRDRMYFTFGAYALLLALSIASLSGVADELLWGEYPRWADAAKSFFPLAAAGMSVFLVMALCRVRARSLVLGRVSAAVGAVIVGIAVASAVLQAVWTLAFAAGMLAAAAMVFAVAGWTWRRGGTMGAWVAAAHAPMIASTALIVLRMFDIEPVPFRPNVLVSVSAGFILLLMLVALIQRSKELLAVRVRAQGMESIDPLTGMLSGALFADRVRAAVDRFVRSRHDAAVVYVRLANFNRILERHGLAVAEQSIIRAAMKLQRVMGEADSFGRVGESTLGLIVETVTRREALQERASRLVAHGLMPLPGLKPEVTLVLHVAINVLSENSPGASQLQAALQSRLDAMALRSRKPIRFLEPVATSPAPLLGASGNAQVAGEGAGGQRLAVGPEVGGAAVIEDGT